MPGVLHYTLFMNTGRERKETYVHTVRLFSLFCLERKAAPLHLPHLHFKENIFISSWNEGLVFQLAKMQ